MKVKYKWNQTYLMNLVQISYLLKCIHFVVSTTVTSVHIESVDIYTTSETKDGSPIFFRAHPHLASKSMKLFCNSLSPLLGSYMRLLWSPKLPILCLTHFLLMEMVVVGAPLTPVVAYKGTTKFISNLMMVTRLLPSGLCFSCPVLLWSNSSTWL